MPRLLLLTFLSLPAILCAQYKTFVGGFVGVSTLSADGAFSTTASSSAHSQYKPEDGPTAMVFAGRHLCDYFSVQMSYGWNRNTAVLSAAQFGGTQAAYEQERRNTQQTVIGEGLLYFRDRRSWVRPYLTTGAGIHHLRSRAVGREVRAGTPALPPAEFSKSGLAFRVAVGVDVFLRGGFAIRYSFSETIQANPLSERQIPPGVRDLKHFQNLFGASLNF